MIITLNRNNIDKQLRARSFYDHSNESAEAAYPEKSVLYRDNDVTPVIQTAVSELRHVCARFLTHYYEEDTDNTPGTPQSYVFDLDFSERRAAGKGRVLADLMNEYVINSVLAHFGARLKPDSPSVSEHNKKAIEQYAHIQEALYTKTPPTL